MGQGKAPYFKKVHNYISPQMSPIHCCTAQNSGKFDVRKFFSDTGSSGYWLLRKILTEDGHRLSPCTCKHCNAFINSDSVNFGRRVGNSQNIKIMHCTVCR